MINGYQRTAHSRESNESKKKVKVSTGNPYISDHKNTKAVCTKCFKCIFFHKINIGDRARFGLLTDGHICTDYSELK